MSTRRCVACRKTFTGQAVYRRTAQGSQGPFCSVEHMTPVVKPPYVPSAVERAAARYLERYHVTQRGVPVDSVKRLVNHCRLRQTVDIEDSTIDNFPSWYGLQITPGQEFKVAQNLRQAGYVVWMPLALQYRVHAAPPVGNDHQAAPSGSWVVREALRVVPDLTGYIFVAGPAGQRLGDDWLHGLLYPNHGDKKRSAIYEVLRRDEHVEVFAPHELRRFVDHSQSHAPLSYGTAVAVVRGPWSGRAGSVVQWIEDRYAIRLTPTQVEEIPASDIRPADHIAYGSQVVVRTGKHRGLLGTVVHYEHQNYWVESADSHITAVMEDHVKPARYSIGALVGVMAGPHRGVNGRLLRDYGDTLLVWLGDRLGEQRIPTRACAVETPAARGTDRRPMVPLTDQLQRFGSQFFTNLTGYQHEQFEKAVAIWKADHRRKTVRDAALAMFGIPYHALGEPARAILREVFRHSAS